MTKKLPAEKEAFFKQELEKVCKNSRMLESGRYMQHGCTSVFRHSVSVAHYSFYLAWKMHIPVNEKALIRGALLHDYFLYDWHDGKGRHFHGFTHPECAFRNAEKDYALSPRVKIIITRHMFPLTLVPPTCTEAWIVCIADKICAIEETLFNR